MPISADSGRVPIFPCAAFPVLNFAWGRYDAAQRTRTPCSRLLKITVYTTWRYWIHRDVLVMFCCCVFDVSLKTNLYHTVSYWGKIQCTIDIPECNAVMVLWFTAETWLVSAVWVTTCERIGKREEGHVLSQQIKYLIIKKKIFKWYPCERFNFGRNRKNRWWT